MEAHTKMFEAAPDSTPTPLAAAGAEHAQGRQSSDLPSPTPHIPLWSFQHLNPMGQQLWVVSLFQGGKSKVISRCDASMFSLYPRRGSTASLEKGGNVCCLWCKAERWDSKTRVHLPRCPRDFRQGTTFLVLLALSLNLYLVLASRGWGEED